jgi:hypothetical protein
MTHSHARKYTCLLSLESGASIDVLANSLQLTRRGHYIIYCKVYSYATAQETPRLSTCQQYMIIARQRLRKHVPTLNNGSCVLNGRMLQLVARQQSARQ